MPDKHFLQLFTPYKRGILSFKSVTETKSSLSELPGELKTRTTENTRDIAEYK